MAPITRSKEPHSNGHKTVHRKSAPNGHLVLHKNGSDTNRRFRDSEAPSLLAITNGDDADPLRDMVDRVGREVDHFAETLDKYNELLRGEEAYDAAYDLAVEYRNLAQHTAKQLRGRHNSQRVRETVNDYGKRLQSTSHSVPNSGRSSNKENDKPTRDESLEELKQWEVEADTWELFRIMLELRYTPHQDDSAKQKQARLTELGEPNRYTTDAELWERFTMSNDLARERYLVLKWLQGAADHGENDMDSIAEELEKKAGRGSGPWANGWMETREKIKGAKRMRLSSDTTSNQLDIKRTDNNEPLVSTLDPDAPSRQRRTLEKADAYLERSFWMTCWEMLRRGRTWEEVSKWCAERQQTWRSVSLAGYSDSSLDFGMPGYSSGALWRRMCYTLAKNGTKDEYEAAVYALLSGDLDTVKRVCQSWDDHLYAYYNSLLLSHFDQYLQENFQDKVPASLTKRFSTFDALQHHGSENSASSLVATLMRDASTSSKAREPMKLVQGSLIADTFDKLCESLATTLPATPWFQSTTSIRNALSSSAHDDSVESAIAQNFEGLRIVAHMLIALQEFHKPIVQSKNANTNILDNIVAAYVHLLRASGKRDLCPLYASKLSPARAQNVLAQVLSDILDVQEKIDFIKLMKIYEIDPIAVLVEQTHHIIRTQLPEGGSEESSLQIVENALDDIYPGQCIKLDFAANATGGDGVADSLLVFLVIEGHWEVTFDTLAYACRQLLVNGCFLEASHLVQRVSPEQMCLSKSRSILGRSINIMDRDDPSILAPDEEEAALISLMQKQARVYYELCLLIRAIDALDRWRQIEDDYTSRVSRPTTVPAKIKHAFEETCVVVERVLTGILLTSKDESEAADLEKIRTRFLPEVILAYNALLCVGAHMISRDHLIMSMELAAIIADDKNGLADAFVEAGRMRELVTALAGSSEIMLKLNELGKARREKKSKDGSNVAIWELSAADVQSSGEV